MVKIMGPALKKRPPSNQCLPYLHEDYRCTVKRPVEAMNIRYGKSSECSEWRIDHGLLQSITRTLQSGRVLILAKYFANHYYRLFPQPHRLLSSALFGTFQTERTSYVAPLQSLHSEVYVYM